MYIEETLRKRNLPELKSKEEMLEILLSEQYGYLPSKPDSVEFKETDNYIINFCAGKAKSSKVEISCVISGKKFTFPVYVSIPKAGGKHPFFVCVNFRDCVPDRYIPVEEIIDCGFGVLSFCYEDVTRDNADFTDGIAGLLYKNGERGKSDAGKISIWAWAAQRVMDYAQTRDDLDINRSIVCGHSRLGKTALLAAATDERFSCAFSNDSGCCGAAISRGKDGETIKDICSAFPYWFCEKLPFYAERESEMPFDQHYLVASIAPRMVYISSALEDTWADPESEMLTCIAASQIYEKHGKKGFVCEERPPRAGDEFHEGSIGYHLREGLHYFSREDWNKAISFIKKHNL